MRVRVFCNWVCSVHPHLRSDIWFLSRHLPWWSDQKICFTVKIGKITIMIILIDLNIILIKIRWNRFRFHQKNRPKSIYFQVYYMINIKKKDFSEGTTWRKNLSFVLSFIKARRMSQWIVRHQSNSDSEVSSLNENFYYFSEIWKGVRKRSSSHRKILANTLYFMTVDR
jgi:hypothetical protein